MIVYPPFFPAALFSLLSVLLIAANLARADDHITVATASNFAQAARQLGATFEQDSNIKVRWVLGSSGKITAQIRHGAPFDLFLSADQQRPQQLVGEGYAVKGSQFSYAEGGLVLWSNNPKFKATALSEGVLAVPQGQEVRIAIANPKLAPYGLAAMAIIGDNKDIQLIQGENIAQAYQFTRIGKVDAGFIARSQWQQLKEHESKLSWEVPRTRHPAILQDAVLLTRAKNKPAAHAFLQFLRSHKARKIIEKSGYFIPTTRAQQSGLPTP